MKTTTTIANIATRSALILLLSPVLHAATKTVTVGNDMFGATVTGAMSYYAPPQSGTCDFYTTGKVDGKVFYKTMNNIASGAANFTVNTGKTSTKAWGNLKAGGKTLVTWNKSMAGSGDFSTTPILSEQLAGSKTIWVPVPVINIPVPVTVDTHASVDLRAAGTVSYVVSRSQGPTVSARFGPALDVAADASAYVDLLVASGGVTGAVKICKASLDTSVKMTSASPYSQYNVSTVAYAATFNMRSPEGSLTLWGEIAGYRGDLELYKKTGTTSTWVIASGSFKLNGGSILK